ncbi:beta-lactamase family protein [Pseudomonas aeruginosa]|uniref:serine hydrolase domain-containing protein n=1 Tax=Pseudomonas aeruginosa TaxID=287 RepID=UPI0021F1D9EB|nr:serine hydrolase domain-containing protein [Pseudomonas aeruginosa]MCV6142970.1 beta-lactamase family protein [Pseudomonas aeruginosa]
MFRAMHLSLLGCLLGTSGCHGLPPAPPAPSAAVGNYGEVIDYLQRHIRREMERQDVPGLALALVDDQQLVWARGFGYADRQHRINASEHTAFHAGDLSKLLIASATLQLAERGQLSLDAPLQDTLREFYVRSRFHADQSEADRAITFRRLLSHQSGLPGEHLPPLFGERPSSLGQLPAKVSGVWLSNPPGTQVAYSNLGYELVGAAIERNTGKHFEQHMREHLLDPLQMTRSSFARNALPQAQRAHGYSDGGGGGRPPPRPPPPPPPPPPGGAPGGGPPRSGRYRSCSQLTIQATPKRSVNMPKLAAQKVGPSGIWTEPPSARALNRRSASALLSTLRLMEQPLMPS